MAASTAKDNTPWTVTSPYQDDTHAARTINAPPWVDSPNVRGSFDILQSCILTLLACIYTALHLNVPEETEWYQILWAKIRWIMLALFAPELVLFMAVNQLRQAWSLRKNLRGLQAKGADNVDKEFDFNLKYCFFVVMGGVRVDITEILSFDDLDKRPRRYFERLKQREAATVRLNPAGVLELAKKGHWNSIYFSTRMISDKSKADYFQKLLVVIQVSWMIIQSIARKAQGLPLTLLEVHTMVHVACAVFLYACWFKKPLNIEDPEVLKPTDCIGDIAVMVQRQFYTGWKTLLAIGPPQSRSSTRDSRVSEDEDTRRWFKPTPPCRMVGGDVMVTGLTLRSEADKDLHVTSEFLRRWDHIFSVDPFRMYSAIEGRMQENTSTSTHLSPFRLNQFVEFDVKSDEGSSFRRIKQLPFVVYDRNFEYDGDEDDIVDRVLSSFVGPGDQKAALIAWLILPALYGGIHLVAWNWDFATNIEAILWKASCCFVACSWAVMILFTGLLETVDESISADIGATWVIAAIFMLSIFVWVVLYCLARVYIILEAFLSTRHAPVGVYITPDWLQMFPHI